MHISTEKGDIVFKKKDIVSKFPLPKSKIPWCRFTATYVTDKANKILLINSPEENDLTDCMNRLKKKNYGIVLKADFETREKESDFLIGTDMQKVGPFYVYGIRIIEKTQDGFDLLSWYDGRINYETNEYYSDFDRKWAFKTSKKGIEILNEVMDYYKPLLDKAFTTIEAYREGMRIYKEKNNKTDTGTWSEKEYEHRGFLLNYCRIKLFQRIPEAWHVMEMVQHLDRLPKNKKIKVLSIGCGPCFELYAMKKFLEELGYTVDCYGQDPNLEWKPFIPDFVKFNTGLKTADLVVYSYVNNVHTKIPYSDFISDKQTTLLIERSSKPVLGKEGPNVIFLNSVVKNRKGPDAQYVMITPTPLSVEPKKKKDFLYVLDYEKNKTTVDKKKMTNKGKKK